MTARTGAGAWEGIRMPHFLRSRPVILATAEYARLEKSREEGERLSLSVLVDLRLSSSASTVFLFSGGAVLNVGCCASRGGSKKTVRFGRNYDPLR
jgi:hypothetical protein